MSLYRLLFLTTKKTIRATARVMANEPTTIITIFVFSGSVPTASSAATNDVLISNYNYIIHDVL